MVTEQLITLELDPRQLSVEPGQETIFRLRIRNRGTVVDEFVPRVLGAAAGWTTIEPETVRLFPGSEQEVSLHVRPPRSHAVAPEPVSFGVRVIATSAGDSSGVVDEATLSVVPFTDVRAELSPRTSRARRVGRHRLAITNAGNAPAVIRISAADPDESLDIRLSRDRIEVAPGTVKVVRLRVRPAHRGWSGSAAPLPFQAVVEPRGAAAIELSGAMEHRRMFPRWVPAALLLIAALLVALIVIEARTATVGSRATSGAPTGGGAAAGAAAPRTGSGSGGAKVAAGKAPAAKAQATPAPVATSYGLCPSRGTTPPPAIYNADGNALDSGGGHRDGSLENGAGYGAGHSGAPSDQAFTFFGGTSDVVLPGLGDLGGGDFCIALDVKTTGREIGSLIGNRNAASDGRFWDIRIGANGSPYVELDDHGYPKGPTYVGAGGTSAAINDGHWHNVTALRVGTLVNLYVDGTLAGSGASQVVIDVSNGDPARIGADGFVSFSGQIDNVLITQGGI